MRLEKLVSVTMKKGIMSVKGYAFAYCTVLEEILIPESVNSIGRSAFTETPWMNARKKETPLVVVNGILIDGSNASGKVKIPDEVKKIGNEAFAYNNNLKEVIMTDNVTQIEENAFYNCSGLTKITISNNLTSIEPYSFAYCRTLKSITLPKGITSIGDSAFTVCGISKIIIPYGVTKIGENAFSGCGKLTEVSISKTVSFFGGRVLIGRHGWKKN